jgi:soluble lytic murein transglycosylase-like protein
MVFALAYGTGRGAFPTNGIGGTLNYDGTGPGPYYRSHAHDQMKAPGLVGALSLRYTRMCSINDYAVFAAVRALQPFFRAVPDGILGPNTAKAISDYQLKNNLMVDAVIGPQTCRSLFRPIVAYAAKQRDPVHLDLLSHIAIGTIATESEFDPGAVGVTTPQDLGIGQINGEWHPDLSVDERLDPTKAITTVVGFVQDNLMHFGYDQDAAIAAYNLGTSGAHYWLDAKRPRMWKGADIWAYIAKIKAGA